MGRERRSNPRKMRPQFLVLCEGSTEEVYVNFLKQRYRLPIKIVSKVVGSNISNRLITCYKEEFTASNITTFLMYDGDVPEVLEALRKCDGILLISKPCIEIWFIAHHKKVPESAISSNSCIKQLLSLSGWENYKKSFLTFKQQEMLWNNRMIAVENMKKKNFSDKTYSTIHNLITALETEKNKL